MPARFPAPFTMCQIALGVIPSTQIFPSRISRRKIAPSLTPAAVVHASTAHFAQRAVSLSQNLPEAEKYLLVAIQAQITQNLPAAIKAYETMARVSPGNADVQSALAALYEQSGNFANAGESNCVQLASLSSKLLTINTENMVRKGGLEPPCLSAPPPQDGVSANFTTSALGSLTYDRVERSARDQMLNQFLTDVYGKSHQSCTRLCTRSSACKFYTDDIEKFNAVARQT